MNGLIRSVRIRRAVWALALSGWVLTALTAQAFRYHVVASGGDDGNDGLSWAEPLATIPAAIARAVNYDTIILSNGTYNVTASIDLTNGITFTSTNGLQVTTIDAGNVASRRVFYMTNANAVIDGFAITRGYANNSSVPAKDGGACGCRQVGCRIA